MTTRRIARQLYTIGGESLTVQPNAGFATNTIKNPSHLRRILRAHAQWNRPACHYGELRRRPLAQPEVDVNGFQLVPVTPVSMNTNIVVTASTTLTMPSGLTSLGSLTLTATASPMLTMPGRRRRCHLEQQQRTGHLGQRGQRRSRDRWFAADRDRLGQRQR